jgi:hypothetical protein
MMDYARAKGIMDVYFMGSDEASGGILHQERPTWEAVHQCGAKVWVACSTGFFDIAGDLLDLPVVAIGSPDEVPRVHALGRKIWVYSWPAGGSTIEKPYSQRQSYGFRLDRSGMDGIHNYAYQHAEGPGGLLGRPWDDFDSKAYRSLCYTYPTIDGVVDTLQWEAVREGIDDMRYLATLRKAIDAARQSGKEPAKTYAEAAEKWATGFPIDHDLQKIRMEIARRILRLHELMQ